MYLGCLGHVYVFYDGVDTGHTEYFLNAVTLSSEVNGGAKESQLLVACKKHAYGCTVHKNCGGEVEYESSRAAVGQT